MKTAEELGKEGLMQMLRYGGVDEWNLWRTLTEGDDQNRLPTANDRKIVTDLSREDLSGLCLDGINFKRVILRGAKLAYTQLNRAILAQADLRESDLHHAILKEADLTQTKFCGACCTGTNFFCAVLANTDFENTVFDHPVFGKNVDPTAIVWAGAIGLPRQYCGYGPDRFCITPP